MPEYGSHLQLLTRALLVLLGLFLLFSLADARAFLRQIFFSIILVIIVILILARFGGDLGRTV